MRNALSFIAAAALAVPTIIAQQTTPQPSQTQPCQDAPKPPKGFHLGIPKQVQQAVDKERQKIQSQTGQTIPSTDEMKKDLQPKPCKARSDNQQKPSEQVQKPAPATPPVKEQAPVMICPPHAVLVPGQIFCVLPDHSTVEAVPLPSGTLPDQKTAAH